MIISTAPSNAPAARCRAGFTLVEVIIGSTLASFILAGVLSAFLMLGRSGVNVANYSVSEAEVRRALEEFSQDVRMASGLTWNSAKSVTLTVPNPAPAPPSQVTYAYDDSPGSLTFGCFYRVPGAAAATAGRRVLIRNIESLAFTRYNRLDGLTSSDGETKRLQMTLNVRRTDRTAVAANTALVSASYTLRNKVAQ